MRLWKQLFSLFWAPVFSSGKWASKYLTDYLWWINEMVMVIVKTLVWSLTQSWCSISGVSPPPPTLLKVLDTTGGKEMVNVLLWIIHSLCRRFWNLQATIHQFHCIVAGLCSSLCSSIYTALTHIWGTQNISLFVVFCRILPPSYQFPLWMSILWI